MSSDIQTLLQAAKHFDTTAAAIETAFASGGAQSRNRVSPAELTRGFTQFLNIAERVESGDAPAPDEISELGTYGIALLRDLMQWAKELDLEDERVRLESMLLSVTDWLMRNDGMIEELEPVADTLATVANRTWDPLELEHMAQFIDRVIPAVAPTIRQDLEKSNPGRPWRILLLNSGIVATRSHNTAVMERAYDRLAQYLPEEMEGFFEEAMKQMNSLNYPPQVREVVTAYYNRFTRHSMH